MKIWHYPIQINYVVLLAVIQHFGVQNFLWNFS